MTTINICILVTSSRKYFHNVKELGMLIYSVPIKSRLHHPTMSFGYSVSDFFTLSQLAVKVYKAYQNAPDDYQHISEEVAGLQGLIDKAQQHFKSTTISSGDRHHCQKALKGCKSILNDLSSFIEKYKSVASTDKRPVFKRVKLSTEDIATLRERLIANATLLSSFIRRFDISSITIITISC